MTMKIIRILQPALFLAASLLMGCSADEGNGGRHEASRTAIVPTAVVNAPGTSRANSLSGPLQGTSFPQGTANVFAVTDYRTTTSSPTSTPGFDYGAAYFHNEPVSSNASGELGFNTEQYYPTVGRLYFYAYSPVMPEMTADTGYRKGSAAGAPTVTFDISGGLKDILWASHDDGVELAGPGVTQPQPSFKFAHKLQQLQFKFAKGGDFPSGCKVSSIHIQGNPKDAGDDGNKLKDRATLNLSDGTVAYFSSKNGVDNFTHELGKANLWDIDAGDLSGCYVFRPIQRLRLSFEVDMDPVKNPGRNIRTYSADATLVGAQTDVGGRSYLVTVTFVGGIDVKIKVMEKNGWNSCTLVPQKIGE